MSDRSITVFGSCTGENYRQQSRAGEEDEMFRKVWENSERRRMDEYRRAEERHRLESGQEKFLRIVRMIVLILVAFFASLGIYMFLALIL